MIEGQLAGAMEQSDEQHESPYLVLFNADFHEPRIGDHRDDVEDEEHEGGEAPAEAERQQRGKEKFRESAQGGAISGDSKGTEYS